MGVMSSSSPLIDEKPSSVSIVLETDPAQNKEERGCENKWTQNYYEKECDHISDGKMDHRA